MKYVNKNDKWLSKVIYCLGRLCSTLMHYNTTMGWTSYWGTLFIAQICDYKHAAFSVENIVRVFVEFHESKNNSMNLSQKWDNLIHNSWPVTTFNFQPTDLHKTSCLIRNVLSCSPIEIQIKWSLLIMDVLTDQHFSITMQNICCPKLYNHVYPNRYSKSNLWNPISVGIISNNPFVMSLFVYWISDINVFFG